MYYKVKLINSQDDTVTADIVPYPTDDGRVNLIVYSEVARMKAHLERVISQPAYILAPTVARKGSLSDGVMFTPPYSKAYAQALPQILSWSGYLAELVPETHESEDYMDTSVFKSMDSATRQNEKGETIVTYVPSGFLAVHNDGRTLPAGRYLNANIDKEDAEWTLVDNPYEDEDDSVRTQALQQMQNLELDYHPGARPEVYGEETFVEPNKMYKPEGKRLSEMYFGIIQETPTGTLPETAPEGTILYAPRIHTAVRATHWPPANLTDYENEDWYIFTEADEDDETKEFLASMTGYSVPLLTGMDKGIVTVHPDIAAQLSLEDGERFKLPGSDVDDIVINPLRPERAYSNWLRKERKKEEYLEAVAVAEASVKSVKERLSMSVDGQVRVDPTLAEDEIEGLYAEPGDTADFKGKLFAHQNGIVQILTDTSQYEAYGGPVGRNGYFLNSGTGTGKTVAIAAAETVMRNRGHFKEGEQVTMITCPPSLTSVWKSSLLEFTGQDVEIIGDEGMSRTERIAQWEDLLHKARHGALPHMIIVGGSKFRQTKDEDKEYEQGIDAKYMSLLAMGGESKHGKVAGGHVSALVVDESGMYSNPKSRRHQSLMGVIEHIYQGKGLVWTLNGTVSGNSAVDTITELAMIDRGARGASNFDRVVNYYTKKNKDIAGRGASELTRRIWGVDGQPVKSAERRMEFFERFRGQSITVTAEAIAGDEYGKITTEDTITDLGDEWADIYEEALQKVAIARAVKRHSVVFGLVSLMVGSSVGVISPARLMEYGMGVKRMLADIKDMMNSPEYGDELLTDEEFADLQVNIARYQQDFSSVSEEGLGRLPRIDETESARTRMVTINEREKGYKEYFTERQQRALRMSTESWNSPFIDSFVDGVADYFAKGSTDGKNQKAVVAGFSTVAMHRIFQRLKEKYGDSKVIQVIDGNTGPKGTDQAEKIHANTKDKDVITIVTSAGLQGLSFPAGRLFRMTTWNSAKGEQYEGRGLRNPFAKMTATVMASKGILSFMRDIEKAKGTMNQAGKDALIDLTDNGEDIDVTMLSTTVFDALFNDERYNIRKGKQ